MHDIRKYWRRFALTTSSINVKNKSEKKVELTDLINIDALVLTLFGRVEWIIFGHVLNVEDEIRLWQYNFLLVYLVYGVLEGQLRAAVLLVMSEYRA